MKNTKKMVALLLAMMLLVGGVIGGTVAYLITQTGTVNNTFTSSDVSITLTETKPTGNTDKMVPGKVIEKDPTVTVLANSEKCYLFVKVDKSENFGSYMTYGMADGWIQLEDQQNQDVVGVFYREVETSTADQPFPVLKDNQVTVIKTLTKTDMANAKDANPTMAFTAYAIQYNYLENVSDAFGAWLLINNSANQ